MREGLRSGKSREGLRSGKCREGLRSGKSREGLQKDEGFSGKVLVQKKLFDMAWKVEASLYVKDELPVSTGAGSFEDSKSEKLDHSVACSVEVEDGVQESKCLEIKKKKVKEEVFDAQVEIVGRVLRSRKRTSDEVEEETVGDKAVNDEKKRGRDHKKETKRIKIEEDDDSYEPGERIVNRKLKRKRGRPPLARGKLGVLKKQLHKKQSVGGLRKSKRILKTNGKLEQGRSTRSSNRETRSGKYVEVKHENEETGEASSIQILGAANMDSIDEQSVAEAGKSIKDGEDAELTRASEKQRQILGAVNMGIIDEQSVAEAVKSIKDGEDEELTRASEKQLVRDRIIELLFSAGWTVEYRPRHGRDYNDAVYVSPDGKTHWSVTLAYRLLKERYEKGDREAYKEGFIFSPIPAEELNILKRVQTKKREGKKKNMVPKMVGTPGKARAVKKRKKKGGFCSGVGSPKRSPGGRGKRKVLQYKMHGTDYTYVAPQSSGKRKRRQTQDRKRFALLVRRSDGAESDADGYVLYNGRRTTLAWMIDSGIVLDKAEASYMNQRKTRAMLQGKITRDGIDCGCCGEVVTVSEFESHAGSKLRRPLENIFLENGSSILECQLDAWKKIESENKWFHLVDVGGDDPNDDTCGICGDGGNLVCCDSCPSTFHQDCLDIQKFPSGDWYCLYCICKYCGKIGEDINPMNSEETNASLLSCCLCEEKYHKSCIHPDNELKDAQGELHFCGRKCLEIYGKIEMLLGVSRLLEEGFSWSLIQRCEVGTDISSGEATRKIECNSKLAVALLVMDECFLPSPDHRSGVNLIHNIVYSCGSNFNRLNFSGFYVITLEMGNEIVAVASIRIHGHILAEMPYIGTRYMYRRRGMCRRLLTAVESVLRSLNVEKLVIPAISELKDTWTSVFGFEPIEASTKKKMRSMNVLVFPGVNMLQKRILVNQSTEENTVHIDGLVASESEDHPMENDAMKVSDSNNISLDKLNMNLASEVIAVNAAEDGKPHVLNSSSQHQNGSSNDLSSDITSESIDCPNCPNGSIGPTQISNEPCKIFESKGANVEIKNTDFDDYKQVEEIHVHHETAESDSLPLMSDGPSPKSSDEPCEIFENQGANVDIKNIDCGDCKQVEDIHVHRNPESDTLPLTSDQPYPKSNDEACNIFENKDANVDIKNTGFDDIKQEEIHVHLQTAESDSPCEIFESTGASVDIKNTDCSDCKQVEEIHVHHQTAVSDSLPLISVKLYPNSSDEPCEIFESKGTNVDIKNTEPGDCEQVEEVHVHLRTAESDSLPLMSDRSFLKSSDEPCMIFASKGANVDVKNTNCDDIKHEEEIHVHHRTAEADSLPLTSDKSYPKSGGTDCDLISSSDPTELDKDFACDVKDSVPLVGSNSL